MKMKKKHIVIISICAFFLLFFICAPFIAADRIENAFQTESEKRFGGRLSCGKVSVSVFSGFPKASINADNVKIMAENGETAAYIENINIVFDIFSLFASKYEISDFIINRPRINMSLVAGYGFSDTAYADKPDTLVSGKAVIDKKNVSGDNIVIKSFIVKDGSAEYSNPENEISAGFDNVNVFASLDRTDGISNLGLNISAGSAYYNYKEISFKDLHIDFKGGIDADNHNKIFILRNCDLFLNDMDFNAAGKISLSSDNNVNADITVEGRDMKLGDIVRFLPADKVNNLDRLSSDTNINFVADIKGGLRNGELPPFAVRLDVNNGGFEYNGDKFFMSDINVHLDVSNPGGSLDDTFVNIRAFKFNMGGNPFSAEGFLKTPVSDLEFGISAAGVLDLSILKDFYKNDDFYLTGVINPDIHIAGSLSSLDKGEYRKITAKGNIYMENVGVKIKNTPEITIRKMMLNAMPEGLEISDTNLKFAGSSFFIKGVINDYMKYILKGGRLNGAFYVSSRYLDLNKLIKDVNSFTDKSVSLKTSAPVSISSGSASDKNQASSEPAAINIPKNINFILNTDFKKVIFDNAILENISGKLTVKDGKAIFDNISAKAFRGTLNLRGEYQPYSVPANKINVDIGVKDISSKEAYGQSDSIKNIVPFFANVDGIVSGGLKASFYTGGDFAPDVYSVNGSGGIAIRKTEITDMKILDSLAAVLMRPDLKTLSAGDVNIDFIIENGDVRTQPFEIASGGNTAVMEGVLRSDNSISYNGSVVLGGSSPIGISIGGFYDNPNVIINAEDAVRAAKEKLNDAINKLL